MKRKRSRIWNRMSKKVTIQNRFGSSIKITYNGYSKVIPYSENYFFDDKSSAAHFFISNPNEDIKIESENPEDGFLVLRITDGKVTKKKISKYPCNIWAFFDWDYDKSYKGRFIIRVVLDDLED